MNAPTQNSDDIRRRERQARRSLERYHLRLRKSRKAGEGYHITTPQGWPILPESVGYPDRGPGVTIEAVESYLADLPNKDYGEIRKHLPETYGVTVTGYHPDVGPVEELLENIASDLPRLLAEEIAAALSEALPERGDIRVVWLEEEFDGYEVKIGDEVVYHIVNAIDG